MHTRASGFVRRLFLASLVGSVVSWSLFGVGSTARAASPNDPHIKAAIARGVEALKKRGAGGAGGYDSLAGYALLKADVPPDDAVIQAHLEKVLVRFQSGGYRPQTHHFYEAGCDLMFLEALHDEQYHPHLLAIVDYLARGQMPIGAWTYPEQSDSGIGDQSITQYAVLGLWAVERAEVPVPPHLWDAIAGWEVQVQKRDGGFAYHPTGQAEGSPSTPTMTIAGISNLYVARQYLHGEVAQERRRRTDEPAKPKEPPKFGVLSRVEAEDVANAAAANEQVDVQPTGPTNYVPRTAVGRIDNALRAASVNFNAVFPQIASDVKQYPYYFWYGLERMASLGNIDTIGGVNWYDAGAEYLLKKQAPSGEWEGGKERTPFALLFLTRATAKILGREPKPGIDVGSGLLAGGRGIPEDLSAIVAVEDGKAETRKAGEPLDDLFAALGDPTTGETIAAQTAIVEKLRLGDREDLVDQLDRVLELAEHPHYEVRRTAMWVLGRAEDLQYVDELSDGILDENLDVAVEARNALCFLSRKPLGLGEADDPFANAAFDADEAQRASVAKAWQQDTHDRWARWVAEKRPYERRDRLSTLPVAEPDDAK